MGCAADRGRGAELAATGRPETNGAARGRHVPVRPSSAFPSGDWSGPAAARQRPLPDRRRRAGPGLGPTRAGL